MLRRRYRESWRPGIFTCAWLLLVLLLSACSENEPRRGRVLLIGIDGANFRAITPLTNQGRLPNLQKLAHEGVHGPVHAHMPLWSPRIWNSIASGKHPKKHGILGFVHDEVLYRSTDRKVHALWNIASDAGLRVGVVNWWNSYPPEKINGVMITDHVIPGMTKQRRLAHGAAEAPESSNVVYPPEWSDRITAIAENGLPPTDTPDPFAPGDALPAWVKTAALSRAFLDDGRIVQMALAIDEELHPDLLMVFLPGIDRVSHWLWGNLEPEDLYPPRLRPSAEERRAGARALYDYYAYTDELIGVLLDRFGADDLRIVVSDHGFEGGVFFQTLTGQHESKKAAEGVFYARGPGILPGSKARGADGPLSVDDITPTILAWLGLPIGADMDGRPLAGQDFGEVRTVPTHDTTPIERVRADESGAEPEVLERLRDLGYIE
jgi:predicted AlkP superfamily phosphohydrolase/phosphomutase